VIPVGFNADAHAARCDGVWFDRMVNTLPPRWQDTIKGTWQSRWHPDEEARRAANLEVLHTVAWLKDAQLAGLRPDSLDMDIKARADVFARHYSAGLRGAHDDQGLAWAKRNMERHGMAAYWPDKKDRPVVSQLARLKDGRFWRGILRRVFAQTVERCNITLGYVNKDEDCYTSNMRVKQRIAQIASNKRVMEQTYLENEFGQQMSVQELSDKGPANRNIRLKELMVRISGMDLIAQDLGHEGVFVTATCPSRMHKFSDTKYGVRANKRYDGTLPNDAQRYMTKQWSLMRSALAREGLKVYGFRVAEPHHDGCPHWHLLLFYPVQTERGFDSMERIKKRFEQYFLHNDSGSERVAAEHRLKYEQIDRAKGSAAAYIAKYISKNINGFKVDYDLYGAPAVESSQRVDTWAATWRIRQFQQMGGAPVGVWRELRRINTDELNTEVMPESLKKSISGVNIGQIGGRTAIGYQLYTMAQGGPCVSRKDLAVTLLKQETGEVNKYQEVKPADVIGVVAVGRNFYKPKHMVAMLGHLGPKAVPTLSRPAFARIESERCQWRSVVRGVVGSSGPALRSGEAAQPWTRVTNCTQLVEFDAQTMRDKVTYTRSKLGKFKQWAKKPPPEQVAALEVLDC
jgi:hypothetical protein